MKYFILIITVCTFLVSCKQDERVNRMSIDFIDKENLKLGLMMYTMYEDRGHRESDSIKYNHVKKIRDSRNIINHHLKNNSFTTSYYTDLNQYRNVLDSISSIIGYKNSLFTQMLNEAKNNLSDQPLYFLTSISLYESEVLKFILSDIGDVGIPFSTTFQFDKSSYQKGDSMLFTYLTFENEVYQNFKYDSITFYLNDEKLKVDYSMDQILSTAIVKFILPDSGSYYLTVYSSFDSPIQKEIVGQRSTRFMVE